MRGDALYAHSSFKPKVEYFKSELLQSGIESLNLGFEKI